MALKITQHPSPNWNERPAFEASGAPLIDTVILHYTGMQSAEAALAHMCSPAAQVSAHYCVNEDGTACELVHPDKRAWHAGVSSWQGRENLNHTSIGIELVNPGHEFGYRDFPARQIETLLELLEQLRVRYDIPAARYLGHSDVAPARKMDPGEKFPWQTLAEGGFGLWPQKDVIDAGRNDGTFVAKKGMIGADVASLNKILSLIGYSVFLGDSYTQSTQDALKAFQRHWRQSRVSGELDRGTQKVLDAIAFQTG